MLVSGIQQFTLLDFPGKTAAIVFTPGCNFRCGYCHNPEFVLPERIKAIQQSFINEEAVFNFLRQRHGLLDGVVITGGEPTLQGDLVPFIRKIRDLGFLVKLDTNGNKPEILMQLFKEGLVDFVAMDVKTSFTNYLNLAGSLANTNRIRQSIELIMHSGVPYEFRATVLKELHTAGVLLDMAKMVKGATTFALQNFRPAHTLNPAYASYHAFTDEDMEEAKTIFNLFVHRVIIR